MANPKQAGLMSSAPLQTHNKTADQTKDNDDNLTKSFDPLIALYALKKNTKKKAGTTRTARSPGSSGCYRTSAAGRSAPARQIQRQTAVSETTRAMEEVLF